MTADVAVNIPMDMKRTAISDLKNLKRSVIHFSYRLRIDISAITIFINANRNINKFSYAMTLERLTFK